MNTSRKETLSLMRKYMLYRLGFVRRSEYEHLAGCYERLTSQYLDLRRQAETMYEQLHGHKRKSQIEGVNYEVL